MSYNGFAMIPGGYCRKLGIWDNFVSKGFLLAPISFFTSAINPTKLERFNALYTL